MSHKFKLTDNVTITAKEDQYLYYNNRSAVIIALHLTKKDNPYYTVEIEAVGNRMFYEDELI